MIHAHNMDMDIVPLSTVPPSPPRAAHVRSRVTPLARSVRCAVLSCQQNNNAATGKKSRVCITWYESDSDYASESESTEEAQPNKRTKY